MSTNSSRVQMLGGLLSRIGDFRLSLFPGRLKLQKTVYFLQVFGFYLGYRFSWYLYGPYSPELIRDGMESEKLKDTFETVAFDADSQKRFDEFLRFLAPYKDKSQQLELLASIHFLANAHTKLSKKDIIHKVSTKQWYFNEAMVQKGWDHLEQFALVPQNI